MTWNFRSNSRFVNNVPVFWKWFFQPIFEWLSLNGIRENWRKLSFVYCSSGCIYIKSNECNGRINLKVPFCKKGVNKLRCHQEWSTSSEQTTFTYLKLRCHWKNKAKIKDAGKNGKSFNNINSNNTNVFLRNLHLLCEKDLPSRSPLFRKILPSFIRFWKHWRYRNFTSMLKYSQQILISHWLKRSEAKTSTSVAKQFHVWRISRLRKKASPLSDC